MLKYKGRPTFFQKGRHSTPPRVGVVREGGRRGGGDMLVPPQESRKMNDPEEYPAEILNLKASKQCVKGVLKKLGRALLGGSVSVLCVCVGGGGVSRREKPPLRTRRKRKTC